MIMIPLTDYAKIKNNYCLAYLGNSHEYLVQLRLLKPVLQRWFPQLNICLCSKDDCFQHIMAVENSIKFSQLREQKSSFAHVKEITFNGKIHPILEFLEESGVKDYAISTQTNSEHSNLCAIISKGNYPTKNLLQTQIQELHRMATGKGFEVQVDGNWEQAGMVMGVESVGLFEAAALGIQTMLVPTGCGEQLFKNMFKDSVVLDHI